MAGRDALFDVTRFGSHDGIVSPPTSLEAYSGRVTP